MLAIEMSGEVVIWYDVGTLVRESKFNVPEFYVSISSAKLALHGVGCPNKNKSSSWALKSPRIILSGIWRIFL